MLEKQEITKKAVKGTITVDPIVMIVKGQSIGECSSCGKNINRGDDVIIGGKRLHRRCFTCVICENELTAGNVFRDPSVESDFGVNYFCREHVRLPFDEKTEKLKNRHH